MNKRRVGIYGGSFNPIHTGHVQLGDELIALGLVDEVWYIVSPQNPFKVNQELMDDDLRLRLTSLALEGHEGLHVCDVEFQLPRPSYMINTLNELERLHPECRFLLVIGADNWMRFPQWYQSEEILHRFGIIVYPRPGTPLADVPQGVLIANTSLLDISSTQIREAMQRDDYQGEGLPPKVWDVLKNGNEFHKASPCHPERM